MAKEKKADDWQIWWDARVKAMEALLGKSEDMVAHAPIPIYFGGEAGGAADVIFFRSHIPGQVAVTCDLIGLDQVPGKLGNYELMICHRDNEEWGASIIAQLAAYTLENALNPGETMDIGPATPEGSTIAAFLFLEYARFAVRGRKAGLLLCLGITDDELKACRKGHAATVEKTLRDKGIYPYTDLYRKTKVRMK